MGGVELAQGTDRAVAQALGVAQEEVELVSEHQREDVGRPAHEQVIEEARRAAPLPRRPGADGRGMGSLTIVPVAGDECGVGIAGRAEVGRVGAHEVQVGDQGMRHRHRRVVAPQLGGEVDGVGVEPHEAIDRPVVQLDRRPIARHHVAVDVAGERRGRHRSLLVSGC
jgi:hypothetical protein